MLNDAVNCPYTWLSSACCACLFLGYGTPGGSLLIHATTSSYLLRTLSPMRVSISISMVSLPYITKTLLRLSLSNVIGITALVRLKPL